MWRGESAVWRWLAGAVGTGLRLPLVCSTITNLSCDEFAQVTVCWTERGARSRCGCSPLLPLSGGRFGAAAGPLTRAIRFDREVFHSAHHCFAPRSGQGQRRFPNGLAPVSQGGDSGDVVKIGDSARSRLIALVSGRDPELHAAGGRGGKPHRRSGRHLRPSSRPRLTDERSAKPYARIAHRRLPPGRVIHRPPARPYFARHGIVPPAPVDDARFARRVFLDLVGLLPPPEELAAFIRDGRGDKRERLVQRLLENHEAFVGHWMPFWMDHLRIGSSLAASIFDNDNSAKPLRWLEGQLRAGAPYDRFVRDFVAGKVFEDYAQSIAPRNEVANAQGRPEMQVAQVIGQTLLGVRLQCASCHDSFVDRWTLRAAWGMANALGGESYEMSRCEIATGESAAPAFLFTELGPIEKPCPPPPTARRSCSPAAQRTFSPARWSIASGRACSGALLDPLDEMVEQEAWHPDLLEWLAGVVVSSST